jgi:ureidoglycolate dehydrogenase (NAD+)
MTDPTDVGSVFGAINIESFMDLQEFTAAIDKAVREIKTSTRTDGVERIYIPGEIEFEMKAQRLVSGIPIPAEVVKDFIILGRNLDLPFPQV